MIIEKNKVYSIEGNGQRPSHMGDGWHEEDAMYTLNATEQHVVAFDITGAYSNSMKSPNPDNCFRQAKKARTLDGFVETPTCNQGGQVIVKSCIVDCQNLRTQDEISGTLQSKNTGGYSLNYTNPVILEEEGSMPDNAVSIGNGQMCNITMKPVANSLDCMHDEQAALYNNLVPERRYIVRRLTPTECARLQGFPDWWCDGVPGSDSAQYKMWGNGMTLPVVWRVLAGIKGLSETRIKESKEK